MFKKIANTLGIFDTDEMDIFRRKIITEADGTERESEPQLISQNVKCHISFKQIDNPDVSTFGTKPKIMTIQVDYAKDIDLQKNDHIIVRKKDGTATLGIYQGNTGNPEASQSRMRVVARMQEDM